MSFWDLRDGTSAATSQSKEFEIEGGNLQPIPDGSTVLAMIDEAKWTTRDEAELIELRWKVLAPDAYKNRRVFQKLWVTDDDPNARDAKAAARKRDKARRMLAAIDANAGGKLTSESSKPDDNALTLHLTNKPMAIKCMVWSLVGEGGEQVTGNWIAAVAPKDKRLEITDAPMPAPGKAPPRPLAHVADDFNDDIPF